MLSELLGLPSGGDSLSQEPTDHLAAIDSLCLGELVDVGDGLGVEPDSDDDAARSCTWHVLNTTSPQPIVLDTSWCHTPY